MAVNLRGVTVVLLPGTGSDDDYVYRAFSSALHDVGAVVVACAPQPSHLIAGYLDELDNAARLGPIAVGGVSIGAAVATSWALAHRASAVAVLAALPAWTGEPESAAAALTARYSAHELRRNGLACAIAQMRTSSPPWLA
jgi:pimeloyl-ACP methyl ester carboxylesterase